MVTFDPLSAAIGGAIIGFAAAALMILNGRIAGISGIFGEALLGSARERDWRIAFLAGLIAAPFVLAAVGHAMPQPQMPESWALIAIGGLLVGFGARLAGGCTSGHGVCGIARFSLRSVVATATFMATAIVVVALARHGLGGQL